MRVLALIADCQLLIAEMPPSPAGRLVTRGSISGPTTALNLAGGMRPVIDTELPFDGAPSALNRTKSRQVFGKTVVGF
jgi:alcohol dehydrogenase